MYLGIIDMVKADILIHVHFANILSQSLLEHTDMYPRQQSVAM